MNEKGAVVRYDDLICGILHYSVISSTIKQDPTLSRIPHIRLTQIPKMGMWLCNNRAVWVCWAVIVWVDWFTMWKSGTCTVIRSDMITLYGSCLLWDVWLSGLWWSGLILYSLGYIWVSCGNVFFYVCQSWSYAEHFFLIYVVGRVWFFDCVVIGLVCVAADIS